MITGTILGDSVLISRMQLMVPKIRERLVPTINRLGLTIERIVKTDKLSGQVLHRRSGRLSRSVNTKMDSTDTAIFATVGAYAPYAGVHEYGWDGTVPAHTRTSTRGNKFLVRSYHMHVPERSYLRSTLAEMADTIRRTIANDAQAAARDALK